ncbi:ethanolamine utilization protein EutN [Desulfosporosinus fructosivorans]|uniref:Ethanolamine utilization protein EutN n=1 Tax=Desulfosporosinus fructosivorans TaxID=2018669 RepID=A0A4Z0R6P5_9FIRM|nr:EutN/CcmL family microcompartment protein [Desulfosporosinus fructosivorans]TGE38811.1 ethanolamine utilization protein EutN [Desulfosporosinus fructosivorans]
MWVGMVIGTLVATPKDESLIGFKLLFVQPKKFYQKQIRTPVVAVDTIGAGTGETVLVVEGSSARHLIGKPQGAVDAAIIGIINNIELNKYLLEE